MKKLWHAIEKFLGVYRWHPKIALRYLPIVEAIRQKADNQLDLNVLEVGSGGLGMAPYLKRRVVGLDVAFDPPFYPLLIPVKGDALHIPFTDNSFYAVVSIDMLEHIPEKQRTQVIQEMVRVAKKMLCVGVPCGQLAEVQDEQLKKEYRMRFGRDFSYLSEQVTHGLPQTDWVSATIKQSAQKYDKKISLHNLGNINLRLRYWLMRGWMSNNVIVNIFYRKVMLLGLPILRRLNHEPTYRRLFFAEFI